MKNPPSTFDHTRAPCAIPLPDSREFNAEGLMLTAILVYLPFVPLSFRGKERGLDTGIKSAADRLDSTPRVSGG